VRDATEKEMEEGGTETAAINIANARTLPI
jgi:hypothetical protein